MTWHVTARVGMADMYNPTLSPEEPRFFVAIRRPGDPDSLGPDPISSIVETIGQAPSPLASDLVTLAATAFSADLKIPRASAGNADRWTRDIRLHVPVSDVGLWTDPAKLLAEVVALPTGDRWEL